MDGVLYKKHEKLQCRILPLTMLLVPEKNFMIINKIELWNFYYITKKIKTLT